MTYAVLGPGSRAGSLGFGFGAITPVQTAGKASTTALLNDAYGKGKVPPEAELASSIFVATLSGSEAQTVAAMQDAITKASTLGAAAACAATGAGALAAPVCGAIGGFISKGIVSALFSGGSAPSCNEEWSNTVNAHAAALEPLVKAHGPDFPGGGEPWLRRKVRSAVLEYYAMLFASGEYIAPGKSVPCDLYYKGHAFTAINDIRGMREKWQAEASLPQHRALWKNRLESTLAGFVLEAKLNRWAKAAVVAKALAEKEYAQLRAVCNPVVPGRPPIRVPGGGRTPCEEKAWDAAITIAASSYLFGVVEGAPAILSTQSNTIRRTFVDEVKQDRAIAGLQNDMAANKALDAAAARLQTSQQILAAMDASFAPGSVVTKSQVLGVGLAILGLAGAVYLYRTHA